MYSDSSDEEVTKRSSQLHREEGIEIEETKELINTRSAEDSTPHQSRPQNNTNDTVIDHKLWPKVYSSLTSGNAEKFANLIKDHKTMLNGTDEDGNTVLHFACLLGEGGGNFDKCINLLMNQQVKGLNKLNKEGYTALGLAVHYLHKTCVEYMLKHPLRHLLNLDYYPGDKEYTLREIIKQTFPELEKELPASLWRNMNSYDGTEILAALEENQLDVFQKELNPTDPNSWYDEPFYSTLLEIACQKKKRNAYVELLFNRGADLNITNRVTGMPLIHATARSGNFELLKNLLNKKNVNIHLTDNEGRTILHWWAGVRQRKTGDKQKLEDCLETIVKSDYVQKKGIDDQDSSGNTALCIAVERKFQDRAELLLQNGADVMALDQGSKTLLEASKSVLDEILDDCLESDDKQVNNTDLKLTLNNGMLKNIVPRMAECKNLRDLLRHPVSLTWLSLKWQKTRFVFFIDLAFYVIFLLSSTAIILCSEYSSTPSDGGVDRHNALGSDNSDITSRMDDSHVTSQIKYIILQLLWYLLNVFLLLLSAREGFQLIAYRMTYLRSPENLMEIVLIISTFMAYSGVVRNMEIKLHFAAVAILVGWFELVLMTGRLPQLSEQLEMLRRVSMTFLRFMKAYVLLLVAFALCFFVIFKGRSQQDGNEMFSNPLLSLVRTIIMFSGELEATSLPFNNMRGTSHVIFIVFVMLVTIVLLNLLSGLAVGDTEAIRNDAETLSLVARLKLVARIEELLNSLPKFMKRFAEGKTETFEVYPNRPNIIGSTTVKSLLNILRKNRRPEKKRRKIGSQKMRSISKQDTPALKVEHQDLEEK